MNCPMFAALSSREMPLPFPPPLPLMASQCFLDMLGVRTTVQHGDRIPSQDPILLVSNHRSFMDPPLVIHAIQQAVHFVCHPYMGQVPLLREFVRSMGGFPLADAEASNQQLFQQASALLRGDRIVGIFPEGAAPMVKFTQPQELSPFQRGFAHLALRMPLERLHILPVAIAAQDEAQESAVPLQLLRWFDPSEPLFNQAGWHPAIFYHDVKVMVGHPRTITATERSAYKGRGGRTLVREITAEMEQSIAQLLQQAF